MENGNRIKSLRQEKDITVQELADMIGKNRATVYRYENGGIENMPAQVLQNIAHVLGTTPAYLMGWTDDPYDYENDPQSLLSEIPDARRKEWLRQGLSTQEMVSRQRAIEEDGRGETTKGADDPIITDDQIKAAFFNGADPDLTQEDRDAIWAEAKSFIRWKIREKRWKESE